MKACCVVLLLWAGALAQEIDTVNFKRAGSHGSILNRAESEAERKDFVTLQKARAAVQRRALADNFLERYPASWLLATVYQIAAGASLELNDRARALEQGRASLRLLPENAPLLVVLAQISIAMGRPADAARHARDALLWLSVFAPRASVKEAEWKKMSRKIEEAARGVIDQAGGKQPWIERPVTASQKGLKFAGSQACKPCHAAQYEAWRKTGMSAMLRPIADAAVLADFSQWIEFPGGPGGAKIRAGGGDRPYFEVAQPGGNWKRFRVDYAIGSKWQQAYATRLADDRLFVFPIQYSALHKKWLNYWATIDPPGSERADIGTFSHLSSETSYQRNCAACHTSQLRLLRLDDATMQKAGFKEPGVNCEMCHGPSARHAAAMSGSDPGLSDPDVPPFRFSRLDHAEATFICGQCHRQSALRNLGSSGEMNYTQDAPWFDRLAESAISGVRRPGVLQRRTIPGDDVHRRVVHAVGMFPPRHGAVCELS